MTTPQLLLIILQAAFFLLLVIAAFTDITTQKIYNWLTLPAIIVGVGLNLSLGELGVPGFTISISLLGLLTGFGVFLVAYLAGGVGGGDVKLMAAIGAIMGFPFVVGAIFWSALVGAFFALGVLIWRGELVRGVGRSLLYLVRIRPQPAFPEPGGPEAVAGATPIPYGVAISVGSIWCWFLHVGLL